MKLVIDIPKELYTNILATWKDIHPQMHSILKNGTPLPKGHGRLFILDEARAKEYFTNFSFSIQKWISEVDISKATLTVIEADKEK